MKKKAKSKSKKPKINENTEFAIFAVPLKSIFKKEKTKLPKTWGLVNEQEKAGLTYKQILKKMKEFDKRWGLVNGQEF